MPPFKDLKGLVFGELEVLRLDESTRGKKLKWYCLCGRCGNTVLIQGNNLSSGNSTTCCADKKKVKQDNSNWSGYEDLSGTYWSSTKRGAQRRNLPFELTMEYCWQLYLNQDKKCALSGLPIAMHVKGERYGEASLDRIDSSKGYLIGNVQWVHKRINRIKMDMTDEEFIFLCHSVYQHTKESS